jgi:thiamine biosynthesis protein ThiI
VRILVRFSGDISTKARNTRKRFLQRLSENLEDALASAGIQGRVERTWSRITVETEDPAAVNLCTRVFGVQSVSPVERRQWTDLDDLLAQAHELFAERVEGRSFAVRARRSGRKLQSIPFRSGDVERELGTLLLAHARKVDLSNPEVTAALEIHPGHVDLFTDRVAGPGGLPLGVGGRALSLVSGGFDSGVASWQMLKRGLALDYLFFNLGGLAHEVGVLRVMKVIADQWSHGHRPQLISVDLRPAVEAMQQTVTPRYWQIVLKRLMMRAADLVADQLGHVALVTGEAVGQVSSQTLQNLAVIDAGSRHLVLRPLVGSNKDEIVSLTRSIGTFDLSAAVGEYCAILPKYPATSSRLEVIERQEAGLDFAQLDKAVAVRQQFDLRGLDVGGIGAEQLETSEVPEGAAVIDLRSKPAYDSWHFPDALHLEYGQALTAYASFRRDTAYVLYCEVGLKSAHLAELMQAEGFDARHFRGGVRQIKSLAGRLVG